MSLTIQLLIASLQADIFNEMAAAVQNYSASLRRIGCSILKNLTYILLMNGLPVCTIPLSLNTFTSSSFLFIQT